MFQQCSRQLDVQRKDFGAVVQSFKKCDLLFYGLWLFIVIVSVFDGYLVVRHRDQIVILELNPVGRALLEWNSGHIWYLLTAKFWGTVLACATLLFLLNVNQHLGRILSIAVALAQLGLLTFLLVA